MSSNALVRYAYGVECKRPRRVVEHPVIGLSAQGVWMAYAVSTQQWGFIVSAFAYGWVYALNISRMRQAPKEPTACDRTTAH